jgi:heptosyltransferase-1
LIGSSENAAKVERLLIVRLSAMGDVIHTLPAAFALREAFPNAMIGWLIEERWAELLCAAGTPRRGPRSQQRPLVDWVHAVSLVAWRKPLFSVGTVQQIAKTWNDVRTSRYDVAVDLQGAIRSAVLARWSGARVVVGAAEPRESPASLWYTRRAIARGSHVIEQSLSVASEVTRARLVTPRVKFPHDHVAEQKMEQWLLQNNIGNFAIMNPGAGWGAKRWPAERYGRVARALGEDGVRTILNCGPGEDELAREAESASEGAAKGVQCSIGELIALTRRARLFIGGDTGPLHLAAALQIPVVAIFGPTDPARNGPFGTQGIVLRNPDSETSHARKSQPDEGMLEIGVDAVVDAARSLLAKVKSGGQECPPHTGAARRGGVHG